MNLLFCIFLAILARCSATNYESDPEVIELTDIDFSEIVLQSNETWVIEFYEEWNEKCHKFKPEFMEAAILLKGVAKLASIDGKSNPSSVSHCGVKIFPNITVLVDKNHPQHYSGDWSAIAITDEVKKISAEHQGVTIKTDTSSTPSVNSQLGDILKAIAALQVSQEKLFDLLKQNDEKQSERFNELKLNLGNISSQISDLKAQKN